MADAVAVVVGDNVIAASAQSAFRVKVNRQLCEMLNPNKQLIRPRMKKVSYR
jgi:hypothetical protein